MYPTSYLSLEDIQLGGETNIEPFSFQDPGINGAVKNQPHYTYGYVGPLPAE